MGGRSRHIYLINVSDVRGLVNADAMGSITPLVLGVFVSRLTLRPRKFVAGGFLAVAAPERISANAPPRVLPRSSGAGLVA